MFPLHRLQTYSCAGHPRLPIQRVGPLNGTSTVLPLKTMSYGKKGTHQDDRNVTVRTTIGQIDASTIADESESTKIDGPDEPMIVNTTETANENGSAVNTTNQGTPIQTPNTAQTQSIGVSTILSTSKGLDPNQVEPHVIQDRPPTRNTTQLVSNRTVPNTGGTRTDSMSSRTDQTPSTGTGLGTPVPNRWE